MGTLGIPETIFIFVLALLLFGPKKLPELGRTLGKALAEFRRAQGELKATFDREMKNLERESESLKEATNSYHQDSYNYDHTYDNSYDPDSYNYGSHDSTATDSITASASATQGAESTTATLHLTGQPPEGTISSGSYDHGNGTATAEHPGMELTTVPSAPSGPIHDLTPDAHPVSNGHASESSAAEPTVKS